MSSKLHLGEGFSIPADAVTETFGLLAMRGAGKSNAAAVMAEEMFAAGLPFVAIDPVGSWWGLRSARDGKAPGLPVPIFGGRRGDVPLERTGGVLVADTIVDTRLSCVLDLTEFESEAAKKAFLLDFARRVYQRNSEPLHLFLEEADDYIPQKPMRDEAHLLRAWENIVRRGRARGIGVTLITQRSASINKSVLTQVGTLIALRTTGPQDRDAIESWVRYYDANREILSSLAELASGDAWVWSPQFLKRTERVHFRQRNTFDSGATPKTAKTATRAPATLADVDLDAVRTAMSATIERAKAENPKELQRQLAQALRDLEVERARKSESQQVEVPVPSLPDGFGAELNELHTKLGGLLVDVERLKKRSREVGRVRIEPTPREIEPAATRGEQRRTITHPRPARSTTSRGARSIGAGERYVLTAIAQHTPAGGCTREQLTVLTGYKRSSRDTYLQRLMAAGFIARAGEAHIGITAAGIAALGNFERLPTGDRLREHWLAELPEGERRVLEVVAAAYPAAITRDEISRLTDYRRSSRDTYLQRLSARRLVTNNDAGVRASDQLFDARGRS